MRYRVGDTVNKSLRPTIFASFVLVVLLLLAIPSALAGTTVFNVTLTDSSPYSHYCGRPYEWYYQKFTITAYETGVHTFTIQNDTVPAGGGWLLLYEHGNFVPANDCLNVLANGRPTISPTLTAGQKYTLIASEYTAYETGTYEIVYDYLGTAPKVAVEEVASNPDPDGDGIPSYRDNCAQAYNPDQEDGWGSAMGDACDTDWYNMRGIGINGFEQKDGMYHLHGNCTIMDDGAPRCPEVAIFDPASFTPEAMPQEYTTAYAGTWSVWVYYLHSNNGADVYQVNVYSTNPPQPDTLLDDRLEIHVNGGSWQWYQRGGASGSSSAPSSSSGASGSTRG
ncbi:MAG: hypothetical protein CL610_14995 [Anaerolineaceae bacterium]|nr:hypothetical protein [Anaerolineaceae bacterium]